MRQSTKDVASRAHARARSAALALTAAIALVLTGCTGGTAPPKAGGAIATSPIPVSPSVSPSSPPVVAPTYRPADSAEQNLEYFNLVNSRFLAAGLTPGGQAIVDNLVAAGFDKSAMQVTPDATSIGRDVDSLQFSVRINGRCLVGQTSAAGYVGIAGPAVFGTSCLVGVTRAIDW